MIILMKNIFMQKIILLSFSIIFLFAYSGCKNVDCSLDKIDQYYLKEGAAYYFKMFDENYKPVADGKIFVKYKQKLHISGTYSLDSLFQPNYPGLSSMLGEFTGAENTDDNTVVLNTNPKNTNNNVMLEFKLEANKIIGKWYYSSSNANGMEGILSGMKLK